MKKHLLFTVTSDLSHDQRMIRICGSLEHAGFKVQLIGRKKPDSRALESQSFEQIRLKPFFHKGKLFYLEYNIRLFFYLLFQRFDLACGIDLDTGLAAYWASKIKGKPFVFDAHEYFTEIPELVDRPSVKRIWLHIEKYLIHRTKYAYTVSQSIANIFAGLYGRHFEVIRNVSLLQEYGKPANNENAIIYVGAVNMGRGLEELILAMRNIESELWICGEGDVKTDLEKLVKKLGLNEKVKFLGNVPVDRLFELTKRAKVGYLMLSFQGLSYYYSLANKFFDYMHAGLPQITIRFPEYELINSEYEVAVLTDLQVDKITVAINQLLEDKNLYERLHLNALRAREVFNWENEEKKLIEFYQNILKP